MHVRLTMAAACALSVAAVSAPTFAQAYNRFISTNAFHYNFHNTADDTFVSQRLDFGPYMPISASTTGSAANGSTWNDIGKIQADTVLADGGHAPVIKLYSSDSETQGGQSIADHAYAAFEDWLVFTGPGLGSHGTAVFDIHVDGTVAATGGGYWDFTMYSDTGVNFDHQLYERQSAIDGLGTEQISHDFLLQVNWNYGQVTPIALNVQTTAGVFGSPGSAYADFSHTVVWGGLQSVTTSTGQNVTNAAVVQSGSGLDFQTPPPAGGVPEPATWTMMLAGFGGLGAAMRRRRGQVGGFVSEDFLPG